MPAPMVTVVWIVVEIIPPRLKEPAYRLYEMRLRHELENSKSALPRHIAVLCDGNRRWARDAGYNDVSYGYAAVVRGGGHRDGDGLPAVDGESPARPRGTR